MKSTPFAPITFTLFLSILIGLAPAFGQSNTATGKLKVTVRPKQAYVFVDGKAIHEGNQTIRLSAGKHTVGVYNYGYLPQTENVDIAPGATRQIGMALQASGDKVSGPFGDIEFKGHPHAAVLLNGNTPAYFVGHVDEFDNNWLWHQWLLVKPNQYQVVVTQHGQTLWSGDVNVRAGQRVVVDLNHNGAMKSRDFKAGFALGPQPRFESGVASAVVPVAPVTAQLSASQDQTSCGQSAMLNWKSTDAVDTSFNSLGEVPPNGERMVSPTGKTTYEFIAKGPGGEAKQTATIDVSIQPTATLALSQPEVRYHKIGDKVVEQDAATLRWSASNADKVSITPLGNVASSGSQTIEAAPNGTSSGPIQREITYTLRATNACGGTATRTATLHIDGSIDQAPPVTLASLFYPTNYPDQKHPQIGLVKSQEETIIKAADTLKNHEQYDKPDKLTIIGHADERGSAKYNLALSERRADLVKDFLVSQGVAASQIDVRAEGKGQPLSEDQVKKLLSQDSPQPPEWMTSKEKATWLAYNRRVDIVLEPQGQESTETYPVAAPEARVLWQVPEPNLKTVESLSQPPQGNEHAQLH